MGYYALPIAHCQIEIDTRLMPHNTLVHDSLSDEQ